MGEMATLVQGTPGSRPVADVTTVPLLRRVVESLATMRPGRYTVYLGRPDPAAVRAEWDQEVALLRSARRAVVTTPDTTPLPQEADRRDPGLGWLAHIWFSAVMGDDTAMAVICRPDAVCRTSAESQIGSDSRQKMIAQRVKCPTVWQPKELH